MVHSSVDKIELTQLSSRWAKYPMIVPHQQSVPTEHALKYILFAVPPVKIGLHFVKLYVFSGKIQVLVRWLTDIRLILIIILHLISCESADETFINIPIPVWK